MAEDELEESEAFLHLAEARYELANAERAILHDLAQYDLAPLRGRVDEARERVRAAREAVRTRRQALEETTDRWWSAYAQHVSSGGNTRTFWIGSP